MHEYDATLKGILTRLAGSVLARLTGLSVASWHNVELPAVRHRRADLLGETADGRLLHIELQSANQAHMARRMLEYSLAIHRKFRRFPHQMVLYVGNAPLRMRTHLSGPGLSFDCRMTDIRELDAEPLLDSPVLEDNVLAILARRGNDRESVRRILRKIADHPPAGRGEAIAELMILSGLRKLGSLIEGEIEQMPILDDIMDHEVLGRERKRGIALGRAEGKAEGMAEGERRILTGLITKRFGPIPDWAKQHLETLTVPDLEQLSLRLFDAPTLHDLLGVPIPPVV
jgi:predicted transposase YdaD